MASGDVKNNENHKQSAPKVSACKKHKETPIDNRKIAKAQVGKTLRGCGDGVSNCLYETKLCNVDEECSTDSQADFAIKSQFSAHNTEKQLPQGAQASAADALISLSENSVTRTLIYVEELQECQLGYESDSPAQNDAHSSPLAYMYYDSEAYEYLEDNCQSIMLPSTRKESSKSLLETKDATQCEISPLEKWCVKEEHGKRSFGGENEKLRNAQRLVAKAELTSLTNESVESISVRTSAGAPLDVVEKQQQQHTKSSLRQHADLPLQLRYYYEDESRNEPDHKQQQKLPIDFKHSFCNHGDTTLVFNAHFDVTQIDAFEVAALQVDPNDHWLIIDYFFLHDPVNTRFLRHSKLEKHGWLVLLGMQIPYIYRGAQQYSPLFIVEHAYHEVFNAFYPLYCYSNCITVPTVYATPQEMALLSFMTDEVYHYCDYNRILVRKSDVIQLFHFLRHCILRVWRIPSKRPFGLLKILGSLVPYVKVCQESVVPLVFLKRFGNICSPADVVLCNWTLAFIKFACIIIDKQEVVVNEIVLPAINLRHLLTKLLPAGVEVIVNVWPSPSSYFRRLIPIRCNSLEWTAKPVECAFRQPADSTINSGV